MSGELTDQQPLQSYHPQPTNLALGQAAAQRAVEILQEYMPGIQSLRDVSVEDCNRCAEKLPEEVSKRVREMSDSKEE